MSYGWNEEVLADTPASRWRLGDAVGSSTCLDSMGGAAGTVRGGVTLGQPSLVDSDSDTAALFDGSTGYVIIADRPGVKINGAGAVEFWITATSYRDSRGLGGCIYDGGSGEPIVRFADTLDGTLLVRINSVGNICTSNGTVALGVRTHVMVTFSISSGQLSARIYINHSDVTGTVTAVTVTRNSLSKCIGAADQGANNFFQGTIDELSIYNTTQLSASRARAHQRSAFGLAKTAARRLPWLDQSIASGSRTKLTIPKPTGAKVNDLLCVGVIMNSTTQTLSDAARAFTIPTNGVQTNTTASKQHEVVYLWHRIASGDPASWDITWDGSSQTCEATIFVVRGAPSTGNPINVVAGAALTSAGTAVPFAGAIPTARGLAICLWVRFSSSGFPNQPDYWFYGAGLSGGVARIGTFERQHLGAYKMPYMTNFTGGSDAWTTLQIVIADGGVQSSFVNPAIGLDGVTSPNDTGETGWPDGYTPTQAIGGGFVRVDFGPGDTQGNRDQEFIDAAAKGLRVLPLIWLNQQISTIDVPTFTAYVAAFVARYGPGGTFWSGRSDGYLAPEYIELFNEPYGTWFVGTVEPASYANIYKQSVIAGRAANPRCKYLMAGIDRYYDGRAWQNWFQPMFAAQSDLASYIDGVTVHLYGTKPLDLSYSGSYDEWGGIIDTLTPYLYGQGLEVGGACKIWVTEFGFTTCSNTASPDYGVSQADQASMMLDALRLFWGRWQDVMGGFFIYRYRDGSTDTREDRWGISNNDNTDKPAKTALRAWTAQWLGSFVHQYGPDQWLANSVNVYDGRAWNQAPRAVIAG